MNIRQQVVLILGEQAHAPEQEVGPRLRELGWVIGGQPGEVEVECSGVISAGVFVLVVLMVGGAKLQRVVPHDLGDIAEPVVIAVKVIVVAEAAEVIATGEVQGGNASERGRARQGYGVHHIGRSFRRHQANVAAGDRAV